jgi:hypothetical protein
LPYFKPFREYELALAVLTGVFYGLYAMFFSILFCGEDHRTPLVACRPVNAFLFVAGLGPFGLGYIVLFYLAYLRKKAMVVSWLLLAVASTVIYVYNHFGDLPNEQQVSALTGKLFYDGGTIMEGVLPHAFVFSVLLYFLVTPKRATKKLAKSINQDVPKTKIDPD